MVYNKIVKERAPNSDVIRLIRFAAILWIGYLIVLAIISQSFRGPLRNSVLYYILLGYIALFCLALTYWPWIQERLRQAFVPVVIAIITILPVVVNQLMGRLSPLGPRFAPPESAVLATFPFLFVGLLLVAWQYKWQHILFIILGIAGLNLLMGLSLSEPDRPPFPGRPPLPDRLPFQGPLVLTLIQTVIFLVVGFSISFLMSRLRENQRSLEAANIRLSHYASTLEHLATSRERSRLALELHDTLAHTLSGLSLQLETMKAYWEVDQKTARSILDKSLAAAHSGLEETRRALKALRASPLDDLGLARALSTMVEEAAARANLALDMPEIIIMPPLSPDVEQCIYRVAQEAVTNVVKHANAKNITVKLEAVKGKAELTVRDDGIGFDMEKSSEASHFGLKGMQERAGLVGGELTIVSKPGSGTAIRLVI